MRCKRASTSLVRVLAPAEAYGIRYRTAYKEAALDIRWICGAPVSVYSFFRGLPDMAGNAFTVRAVAVRIEAD